MTHDEMKFKSAMLHERSEKADTLLAEIDYMRRVDIAQADAIYMQGGCRSTLVSGELLRDVLQRGITAAIEAREIEIMDLLDVHARCGACGGAGSTSGEAAAARLRGV